MSLGVHQDDGVGGYLRVVGFKKVLDRRVEIVSGLLHQYRLRQRLRMRGRELKRREEGRETCVVASTRTTAFDATSGSSASMKYSTVESRSSAASSTKTA